MSPTENVWCYGTSIIATICVYMYWDRYTYYHTWFHVIFIHSWERYHCLVLTDKETEAQFSTLNKHSCWVAGLNLHLRLTCFGPLSGPLCLSPSLICMGCSEMWRRKVQLEKKTGIRPKIIWSFKIIVLFQRATGVFYRVLPSGWKRNDKDMKNSELDRTEFVTNSYYN